MILYFFLFIFNFSCLDAATNWDLSFQDPATPIMEGIINFHNRFFIAWSTAIFSLLFFVWWVKTI